MESRHVSVSDGISRFLSLLAILVALGSAVFLYQNNQRLKMELATIKGSQENPEVFETHAKTWDEKLRTALTEFNDRANDSVTQFDAAREARNRLVKADAENSSGLVREDVELIVAQQMEQMEQATSKPELRLAHSVMKPTTDGDPVAAIVKNVGTVDAEIKVARFRPKPDGQFRAKQPAEPDDDQVVIEFGPSHNEPTKAGHHRFYERTYLFAYQILPANETVNVTVEIRANGRHLDWGMMGDLELEYQDGRLLLIPNTRAVFVPDKEETT